MNALQLGEKETAASPSKAVEVGNKKIYTT
jgi:hypothetical protein